MTQTDLGDQTVLDSAVQLPGRYQVRVDPSRDELLTDFGRATLRDRYLMPGEGFQDLFARVASYYGDDPGHAQRIYDYISRSGSCRRRRCFSNGGTNARPADLVLPERGERQPRRHRRPLERERLLASRGGGIGSYWGNLRSIGEKVGQNGKTSGVIPFIRVMDSLTLAICQGSLRRGSAAVYLPISHPEIEEFVEMRRPTGGDPNRKALNLHHGLLIPDAFMRAVEADEPWALTSPKDGSVVRKIQARVPVDTHPHGPDRDRRTLPRVQRPREPGTPEHQKLAGLEVKTSNLCSEITLPTGLDQHGRSAPPSAA